MSQSITEMDEGEQFWQGTEDLAHPKLSERQLSMLEPLGARRTLRRGDMVYNAGQRDVGLTVVLSGSIEVFESREGEDQILGTMGPGYFAGDVAALMGTAAIASVRGGAEESDILEVPAKRLREALAALPGVAEPIVRAFVLRRQRLQRDGKFSGLRVLDQQGARDGRQLDDFLDKNHIPHRLIDAKGDVGRGLSQRLRLSCGDLPTLITARGLPLRRPSLREVAREAGLLRTLAADEDGKASCDLAVIGAGPAGLAAAIYAASEGLNTVVLEGFAPGGQAASSSLLENFFGFPTGIVGGDLTYSAQLQAFRFGARFATPARVLSITFAEGKPGAYVQAEGCDAPISAKCVVVATGVNYRRLDADRREEFEGVGLYYAATGRERLFCHGSTVVVIGGGNSAGQAAMFLSESAEKVLMVIRGEGLAESMSSYLSERVEEKKNIEIVANTEVRKMFGGRALEAVELENIGTHERRTVQTSAVFSMIGATPNTEWLPPEIECDERGFIKTGAAVADAPAWNGAKPGPSPFETSCPGIFAVGDVRSGSVKRCAAAVGEGGAAIAGVHASLATYAK